MNAAGRGSNLLLYKQVVAGLAGIAVLAAAVAIEVGKALPGITVRAEGKVVKVQSLVQGEPLVIFFRGVLDCVAVKQARERLAGDRLRLAVISTEANPCPGVFTSAETAADRVVIVDPYGIVRLVKPLGAVGDAVTIATDWEAGRQSFLVDCGHCHGNDGADLSYAGIKTLAGVSHRLTGEKILEGGEQFGAVDMSSWTKASKDALLLYIQGL